MVVIITYIYLNIDKPLAIFAHEHIINGWYALFNGITQLGRNVIYMVILPLAALFFHFAKRNQLTSERLWFLFFCVLIPNIICGVLKVSLGRARPEWLFLADVYGFHGPDFNSNFWSFPSGHTTTVMGMAIGLLFLMPRYGLYFLTIGVIVAFSRVAIGQHYLSDVLSALYLTSLELAIIIPFTRKRGYLPRALKID